MVTKIKVINHCYSSFVVVNLMAAGNIHSFVAYTEGTITAFDCIHQGHHLAIITSSFVGVLSICPWEVAIEFGPRDIQIEVVASLVMPSQVHNPLADSFGVERSIGNPFAFDCREVDLAYLRVVDL